MDNKISATIQSITTGPRQTNIELLRIVAMLLVVIVHSDFWSLSQPKWTYFEIDPLNAITRVFFQSAGIVAVNLFVLISGWFGIRFSKKGLLNFLFQCAYFFVGIYLVLLITGEGKLTIREIADCLALYSSYWFVKAYLALYIISPILNAFIERADKKQFEITLILFYAFQFTYGWTNAAEWMAQGYSAFSFMGLYLLARYVRIYGLPIVTRHGALIYFITIFPTGFLYYFLDRIDVNLMSAGSFISPFVVLGSLGLFSWFVNLKIKHSKVINWISASAFAVYLFHCNPYIVKNYFWVGVRDIYQSYSGIICLLLIGAFDIAVFITGILLDQPRRFLWKVISDKYFK